MDNAKSVKTSPEETEINKNNSILNVRLMSANLTKYSPRKAHVHSASLMRKLKPMERPVQFHHAVTELRDFYQMLLSKLALNTQEQLRIADNVLQTHVL